MNLNHMNLGCIKDKPDERDFRFVKAVHWTEIAPIDLRPLCPPIRSQGPIGACTAFGCTELFDFVRRKNNLINWTPSPLFTYYATRKFANLQDQDSGASIREALKSTVRDGVAMERYWPYDTSKFREHPPEDVWINAEKHQTLQYLKVDDFDKSAFLGCLNDGYPFVFGILLYNSFNSFQTVLSGQVPIPDKENEKIIGGHCMMAVGYKKIDEGGAGKEFIIVQNSWGNNWADHGYCYIPMEYMMSNDAFDFWTIRLTEECAEDTVDPEPIPEPPKPTPEPPKPEPTPEPPKPEPEPPKPTPEPPKPEVVPEPSVVDEEQKKSIWKKPFVYFLIVFILTTLAFFLA